MDAVRVELLRVGPFWRRRYIVKCDVCGPSNSAPTKELGRIRLESHRLLHDCGLG